MKKKNKQKEKNYGKMNIFFKCFHGNLKGISKYISSFHLKKNLELFTHYYDCSIKNLKLKLRTVVMVTR